MHGVFARLCEPVEYISRLEREKMVYAVLHSAETAPFDGHKTVSSKQQAVEI
jgi:hypothetical protein